MTLNDSNIIDYQELISPNELLNVMPCNDLVKSFVINSRERINNILNGTSDRILFIVGPCSIHNIDEAKIYGNMLKNISYKVEDKIEIVMRTYFEKPRTTVGWKGYINDPYLNNTHNVNIGLKNARELLIYLNTIGLPCGCEILNTITPQYILDLISWGSIGARTYESQIHRQLVSGLSIPVGFKNGTSGDIEGSCNSIKFSMNSHTFMGINANGKASLCHTKGNLNTHLILRGGKDRPNYYDFDVKNAEKNMESKNLKPRIVIDCSHGNSRKLYYKQANVLKNVLEQIKDSRRNGDENTIKGVMLESNIYDGSQNLVLDSNLKYGISITDPCLNIEDTEEIIMDFYNKL